MKKLHARKLSLTIAFVEKFVKRNQKASIAYSLVISKYGPQTQEFKTGFHKLYNDGVSHLRNIKRFRIEPIKALDYRVFFGRMALFLVASSVFNFA